MLVHDSDAEKGTNRPDENSGPGSSARVPGNGVTAMSPTPSVPSSPVPPSSVPTSSVSSSSGGVGEVRVRRRGVRTFGLLVGVSVLSAGVGWGVARRIKSPADVAARTASPVASRIVAPVEEKELRSTLFRRGTIRFGSPKAISLPLSALKTGSMIVTSPPVKGASIVEGDRVAEISGRSLLVLQGAQPMYRDIKPGDSGNDVVQLKAALTRLGFPAGSGSAYDAATERAVSSWLGAKGLDPFGASEAQRDRLKGLRDGLQKAEEAVASAKLALSKGNVPLTRDKILQADEAVRTAREKVASSRAESPRATSELELARERKRLAVETAKTTLANAQLALERSRTDRSTELSVADAQLAVTTANQKVTETADQVTKATLAVSDANYAVEDAKFAVADAQAALSDAQLSLRLAQEEVQRQKDKAVPEGAPQSTETFTLDEDAKAAAVRGAQDALVQSRAGLRNANAGLRGAQRELANLQATANTARENGTPGPTNADLSVAAAAVRDAEAAVEDATLAVKNAEDEVARQIAKSAPRVPSNTTIKTLDPAAKEAAIRQAESGVTSAQAGVRSAQTAVRNAQRAQQKAEAAAADAQRALDLLKPSVDVAKEQARISGLRLAQAQTDSTGGAGSAKRTPEQLQQDIDAASSNLKLVDREYKDALGNDSAVDANKAAVRAADAALKIAVAQRAELDKPADLAQLRAGVASAQKSQANAVRDLNEFKATIGVYVPANEVLFFPALPLRVDESKLVAGDVVTGVLMTVASPNLTIDSNVETADAGSLRAGMPAEIELSDFNLTVPATIGEVAKQPGTNGVDASTVYVSLIPQEDQARTTESTDGSGGGAIAVDPSGGPSAPTLRDLNGTSVKVTIPISSTGGKVLAVPTAAVSAAADGSTRVEVEDEPGKPTRFVSVKAGLRAEGFVQVTPKEPGTLKAGDNVVTGNQSGELLQGALEENDKPASGSDTTPNASSTEAGAASSEASTGETPPGSEVPTSSASAA